ncbi:MAG: hydroxymethylbilane synthase [Gemmatimonadaceae bacterium]
MTARNVRIATRSSDLALNQARIVESALTSQGFTCEIVTFKTTGDKNLDQPLSEIGAKGLFTHELEVALKKKKVDCCVHSLKDLPTELPDGLAIAAILTREDPRDVVVLNRVTGADDLASLPPGSRVGTSSLRRRAQLAARHPRLEVVELRGNVPTRLQKVESGMVHGAILAAAGLIRLGATQRISEFLDAPDWLPAAGQGAIAVECRDDDSEMRQILAGLDHAATRREVTAERAFLAGLDGGCQVPIGALATNSLDGGMRLHGFVSDLAGREVVRGSIALPDDSDPVEVGLGLAAELRTRGASSLLLALREGTKFISPQPE